MCQVVKLEDVAAAAETTTTNLFTQVPDLLNLAISAPEVPGGVIYRGSCWCCGEADVSDFPYSTCLACCKPGMEWS